MVENEKYCWTWNATVLEPQKAPKAKIDLRSLEFDKIGSLSKSTLTDTGENVQK